MFTVITYNLPLTNLKTRNKLASLFAENMKDNPIFSYWIPPEKINNIISKLFIDRLSSQASGSKVIFTEDFISAAILSSLKHSFFPVIVTFYKFSKYLSLKDFSSWYRLFFISHYLNKNKFVNETLYLESLVTNTNFYNRGYATSILNSVEQYCKLNGNNIICETHNSILKKILIKRGWIEKPIVSTHINLNNICFMIFTNKSS